MNFSISHILSYTVTFIVAGFSLLLFLIPAVDFGYWEVWTQVLRTAPFIEFYSLISVDYLPGSLYILWLWSSIHALFFNDIISYQSFIKILVTLFTVGNALLVYALTRNRSTFLYYVVTLIYAINALMWAQFDSVFTLCALLSFYFLYKSKPIPSIVVFTIGFLIKPHILFIVPAYVMYLWLKKVKLSQLGILLGLSAILFYIACLPFFGLNIFTGLKNLYTTVSNAHGLASSLTFNLWGFLTLGSARNVDAISQYADLIGFTLLATAMVYMLILSKKYLFQEKLEPESLLYRVSLIAFFCVFSITTLLTRIHERYLYIAFPFLLIAVLLSRRSLSGFKTLVIFYWALVVVHVLNLLWVYRLFSKAEGVRFILDHLVFSPEWLLGSIIICGLYGYFVYKLPFFLKQS